MEYVVQSKTFDAAVKSSNSSGPDPNIIRWAGDPISALDFNSTPVMPSFKQRFNNSAHKNSGLFIEDAAPIHDVSKNMLHTSPDDSQAQVITY